jgi:polyisoprenoid-binding protein YceI
MMLSADDRGTLRGAMTSTATIEHRLTDNARGTWRIDPAHSSATFSVRHLMSKVRGRFSDVDGQVVIGATLADCSVAASIPAETVHTGVAMRDDDLRSEGFLNAAHFQTLEFASTAVHDTGAGLQVVGDLTIRDVIHEVVLDVEYLGHDESGLQGEPRIGFSGITTIRRSAYGVGQSPVEGSKVVVGDTVTIDLDIEAVPSADS